MKKDLLIKYAFTLAEVLITLGIVGIVAEFTIPSLYSDYRKSMLSSQFKKAYSELIQILDLSSKDNGAISTWVLPESNDEFIDTYILPYTKATKCTNNCGYPSSISRIVGNDVYVVNQLTAIKLNEKLLFFRSVVASNAHILMWVDLNGVTKPNKLGVDVFVFMITRGKLIALNEDDSYENINSGCLYHGRYCAAKIIRDNLQIKDDYPIK